MPSNTFTVTASVPTVVSDTGPATVLNSGPGTVFYKADETVSATVYDGTIASGGSLTILSTTALITGAGSSASVSVTPLPWNPNLDTSGKLPVAQVPVSGGNGVPAVVNVKDFVWGVKADGRTVADAAITSGQATLTSATASFTSADVGKLVGVLGAGTAGKPLSTTISSVTNATTAVLAATAGATVSAATATVASDDQAALQAVINATATGIIYFPHAIYGLRQSLIPAPGIEYRGDGGGRTIFKVIANDQTNLIHAFGPNAAFTQAAPGVDMIFRDFEIDGSMQTAPTYPGKAKGMYITNLKRCKWIDLYIHDTSATGLGCDFLYDGCEIRGCVVTGCGRENDGTQSGGSGIGIGNTVSSSASDEEPVTVVGNTAIGNKRYGIFVEAQNGGPTVSSRGARIIGNYCRGNGVGIGEAGGRDTIISGNSCTQNTTDGIALDNGTYGAGFQGYETVVSGNDCYANTRDGIRVNQVNTNSRSSVHVTGNHCNYNGGNGIGWLLDANGMVGCRVDGNFVKQNAKSGLRVYYGGSTNTAVIGQTDITDNFVHNNGTAATAGDRDGIRLDLAATDCRIMGNRAFDRQGSKTQGYGIVLSAGTFTGGAIRDNDLRGNLTGAMLTTGATISATTGIADNHGYTPPAPATAAVGASPWTYTAGATPELLFIYSGTVSSITLGGTQIAAGSDRAIPLQPGDAVVVTYTAAPTAAVRRL